MEAATIETDQTNPTPSGPRLVRTTLRTSRLLDFYSRKELIAQTGHQPSAWPLVVLKELVDNSLDACEDASIAPEITVTVDQTGISVTDNGPGLPADTIEDVLDYSVRVSNREPYVAPDRGAQGNALKTIVAMPFVLDGNRGQVDITTGGTRHEIVCRLDRIQQRPAISHEPHPGLEVRNGTSVRLSWPDSASSILSEAHARFLQAGNDYAFLNPHLTLTVDWFGERHRTEATDPSWVKWRPSDPTSAHWYQDEHLERLIAGYIAHDAARGQHRAVRDLVAEFRGLTGTAKQKAVLEVTGLARTPLSALATDHELDKATVRQLLSAMQAHSKPVKPKALGVIGRDHFASRFEVLGCEMETFKYARQFGETDRLPWVIETAFAWCPKAEERRLITGVNWSPGLINPFRELGRAGQSLDAVLEQQRVGQDESVAICLHMACPRVEYSDRGKSAVIIEQ